MVSTIFFMYYDPAVVIGMRNSGLNRSHITYLSPRIR